MRTRALALSLVLGFAGCSSVLGLEAPSGPSADDAPHDGLLPDSDGLTVPDHVTVTGVVSRAGGVIQNQAISFFKMPGRTQIAVSSTDVDGRYTLVVPTGGAPTDGYLFLPAGGSAGIPPTFIYLEGPLIQDVEHSFALNSKATIDNIDPGGANTPFVLVRIRLRDGTPAAGAFVSMNPTALVRYFGPNGAPDSSTSTTTFGAAYASRPNAGVTTISAQLAGMQLAPRTIETFDADDLHDVLLRQP